MTPVVGRAGAAAGPAARRQARLRAAGRGAWRERLAGRPLPHHHRGRLDLAAGVLLRHVHPRGDAVDPDPAGARVRLLPRHAGARGAGASASSSSRARTPRARSCERVEAFARRYTDKVTVLDTAELTLPGVSRRDPRAGLAGAAGHGARAGQRAPRGHARPPADDAALLQARRLLGSSRARRSTLMSGKAFLTRHSPGKGPGGRAPARTPLPRPTPSPGMTVAKADIDLRCRAANLTGERRVTGCPAARFVPVSRRAAKMGPCRFAVIYRRLWLPAQGSGEGRCDRRSGNRTAYSST